MGEQIGPFEMYNEVETGRGIVGLRPGEYINEKGEVVSPVVEIVTVEDPDLDTAPPNVAPPEADTETTSAPIVVEVGTAVEEENVTE